MKKYSQPVQKIKTSLDEMKYSESEVCDKVQQVPTTSCKNRSYLSLPLTECSVSIIISRLYLHSGCDSTRVSLTS